MTNSFWGDIFNYSKKSDIVQILRGIPVFQGLTKFDLIKVSKLLHLRSYKKDEYIFRENEPGESMYIIQSGSVKISKKAKKTSNTLAILDKGSFFGEVSLVDEEARTATATAQVDSQLLGFFRADLMQLIDRNPRLASFILYQLSMVLGKRLRLLDEQVNKSNAPVT